MTPGDLVVDMLASMSWREREAIADRLMPLLDGLFVREERESVSALVAEALAAPVPVAVVTAVRPPKPMVAPKAKTPFYMRSITGFDPTKKVIEQIEGEWLSPLAVVSMKDGDLLMVGQTGGDRRYWVIEKREGAHLSLMVAGSHRIFPGVLRFETDSHGLLREWVRDNVATPKGVVEAPDF